MFDLGRVQLCCAGALIAAGLFLDQITLVSRDYTAVLMAAIVLCSGAAILLIYALMRPARTAMRVISWSLLAVSMLVLMDAGGRLVF